MKDFSHVRGFNYQPSYGSTSYENWMYFNEDIFRSELENGKKYFPKWNTIRLWLSWDAFVRNHDKFANHFETALRICDELELKVIPILFNRWHECSIDNGGIYIDHFLPKVSWLQQKNNLFEDYMDLFCNKYKDDPRILTYDLCNEPFSYNTSFYAQKSEHPDIVQAEYNWLKYIYDYLKEKGVVTPLGISVHPDHRREGLEYIVNISDVLMVHPYLFESHEDSAAVKKHIELLDTYVEIAKGAGKPLLATEICWGSLDDDYRAKHIAHVLPMLIERGIGFTIHALGHSLVADLHRPEYGPVGKAGFMSFIEADGSLRKGHEIFNKFC